MADHEHEKHVDEHGRTIAALFQSREEARTAIKPLHKAHFTHTWLGTTGVGEKAGGEPVATVETGGFFAGTESLVDALVKHGVDGDAARSLTGYIEAGNAVLTVDPKDHEPEEAISILEQHGGRIADEGAAQWEAWPASKAMSPSPEDLDSLNYEELVFTRR